MLEATRYVSRPTHRPSPAPRQFFKRGDPSVLSRAKRREKIEPLFNRFEVKDSWRISKRKG